MQSNTPPYRYKRRPPSRPQRALLWYSERRPPRYCSWSSVYRLSLVFLQVVSLWKAPSLWTFFFVLSCSSATCKRSCRPYTYTVVADNAELGQASQPSIAGPSQYLNQLLVVFREGTGHSELHICLLFGAVAGERATAVVLTVQRRQSKTPELRVHSNGVSDSRRWLLAADHPCGDGGLPAHLLCRGLHIQVRQGKNCVIDETSFTTTVGDFAVRLLLDVSCTNTMTQPEVVAAAEPLFLSYAFVEVATSSYRCNYNAL